jgi:hypothetical protein
MEADAVLIVETVVLVYRIFGSTWLDTKYRIFGTTSLDTMGDCCSHCIGH